MSCSIRKEAVRVLRETEAGRASEITKEIDGERYVRRFIPEERLILLGGGHIAVPLCKMASMLDFAVTVVDDRPSFANSARFSDAAQVICESFAKAIEDLQIRPSDYVCAITRDRLEAVRESDAILREEFAAAGLARKVWQYFTVVPDFKSTGIRNGRRTFEWCVIVRAINTTDAMSATVEELPFELMQRLVSRITSEVKGVNRVLYDFTPKPCATIEYE